MFSESVLTSCTKAPKTLNTLTPFIGVLAVIVNTFSTGLGYINSDEEAKKEFVDKASLDKASQLEAKLLSNESLIKFR